MHLAENVIHIHSTKLSVDSATLQFYRSLLNKEETVRAERFVTPTLREHYIVAHGFLRQVLSKYLIIDPQSIEFIVNDHDKPSLPSCCSLQFNLSHSGDYAMVAIIQKHPIGVDIEKIRQDQNLEIAERFFSITEVKALLALPKNIQVDAFFQLWSRKEAIIKALGKGLAHSLASFTVTARPCEEKIQFDDITWYLYPVEFQAGYAAAVATSARCQIKYIPAESITL